MTGMKVWEIFPNLTKRIYKDHAEAGMLDGPHDPDHAVRVAQMAFELLENGGLESLAAAVAGLCHNADRILQTKMKIGRRDVQEQIIRDFIKAELDIEVHMDMFEPIPYWIKIIVNAVIGHEGKNQPDDNIVLVALMDADRLVNAEPDIIMRSGQFFSELPTLDRVYLWKNPNATYRNPGSVLRDVMECLPWLTPGDDNPLYVRLPKARKIAKKRKEFLDKFASTLMKCRKETGFYPYPSKLSELQAEFSKVK